jgi:methionyl aminopeptidase
MSIILKSSEEITKMRIAGQFAADVLLMIKPFVKVGVTTEELDQICHNYMVKVQKVVPAPLHYKGFPKSICTSINHVVCHGIPNNKPLKNGDILNIDITIIKDGWHGDTSGMFVVGEPSIRAKRLIDISYECLKRGIAAVKPGVRLGAIGHTIQHYAESQGCSIVRDYCGHGIGRDFHEEPQVLHASKSSEGPVLKTGMTFTIEPMINAGSHDVKKLPDGWTVLTKDRSLSAQWEHTVAVTEHGVEVLTKRPEEDFSNIEKP